MDFDYKKAREFQEKKQIDKERSNCALLHKARSDFNRIIKLIIKKYNPTRVYQWGSLVDGNHFSEISDIDIGLEGVTSAEDFFQLYKDAESLTDFSLDIVQLEKIEPEFRDIIQLKGRVVYECQ